MTRKPQHFNGALPRSDPLLHRGSWREESNKYLPDYYSNRRGGKSLHAVLPDQRCTDNLILPEQNYCAF